MTNTEIEKHLAAPVLKWIAEQGWQNLRKIQEDAIVPILSKSSDIIITAATAGGKTEAAFLSIFSDICHSTTYGLHTICISPLIALIRDQNRRLKQLGAYCNVPVTPWNGDVPQSVKNKFLSKPSGILIITPESLEALLMRHAHQCKTIFSELQYVVIDELHSFMGTERGRQLQSLIYRCTRYCKNDPVRIGLSATLYSMEAAFQYLSMHNNRSHVLISDQNEKRTLRLALKCLNNGDFISTLTNEIYNRYRGNSHLIFSNSRLLAENLGDQLREKCLQNNVPNEFFVHHGNLSKVFRESVELQLQSQDKPATAICTSTLELGIDIGNVDTVAQIGAAPSASSLRQRLGRSGRKTGISTLRVYINEKCNKKEKNIIDLIHWDLFHTIAQIELLFEKWFEPFDSNECGFSTFIQQMLSVIYQYGEVSKENLWSFLCHHGTFRKVSVEDFELIVQNLLALDVLKDNHTKSLVLGAAGEKLTNNYDFYAIFNSEEEYTLMCNGIAIGQYSDQIPSNRTLIFGGLRWKINSINEKKKIIEISPAHQGTIPSFTSTGELFFHQKVREKVRNLYMNKNCPAYLSVEAAESFGDAIQNFFSLGLDTQQIIASNDICYWIPWAGDQQTHKLSMQLRLNGLETMDSWGIISIMGHPVECVLEKIKNIIQQDAADKDLLSVDDYYFQRPERKYDYLLPEELKEKEYCLFMYKS